MNQPLDRPCAVATCDRPVTRSGGLNMCGMHYQRQRKHGSPHVRQVGGASLAEDMNPNWSGPDASYAAVHLRLARKRGRAAANACVDCAQPAAHWSYDNSDPDERRDPNCGRYSHDLDRYQPRCVSCHSRFDRAALITGDRP